MAITVRHLTFGYGPAGVLNDVSLDLPKGRFAALLGKNGSGKSTLLKHLAGFLPSGPGRVRVMGADICALSFQERAKRIGFLPQGHSPVFPFRAEDVVLTGRAASVRVTPGRRDLAKAQAALARVGIAHLAERPYSELSGGECQLVMIARVLAQDPMVLLLDEPLAHLDIANQVKVMRLFKEMTASGLTVLIVLHDPNLALLFADDIALIKEGRILHYGPAGDLRDKALYEAVYDLKLASVPLGERFFLVPACAVPSSSVAGLD